MSTHAALGRGLKALIPEGEPKTQTTTIATALVTANRWQPRERFNEEKQEELIASIKENGLLQPIVVRPRAGGYELIAGERRLRAAQALGHAEIPAVIRDVDDRGALELSLLENLQRDDLNAIEAARGCQRLIDEFSLTQEQVAQRLGKNRSSVANSLRLLKLPGAIQAALQHEELTEGHARALLGLATTAEQLRVFEQLRREHLSVREVEHATRRTHRAKRSGASDPHLRALEEQLQRHLGTRVRIVHGRKRGRIIIEYYSSEDLTRLSRQLQRT
ncbi:MAG: ParB/RepB/Spo0J family partition protein [Candidatus Omnitrophica bacterium]|nr:ParB/RepB/Spo0J family partition protein [Candidatus Omnitrophota bacterium]